MCQLPQETRTGRRGVCLSACLSVYPHYDNYTPLQYAYAAEVYDKMEDHKALVTLYVETHQWDSVCVHYPVHSSIYHDSGICSLIPSPSPLPDFPVFGHNYAIAHTIQSLTLSNTYTMQSLTPCNTYTMQSLTPCTNKREDLCLYVMSRNQKLEAERPGNKTKDSLSSTHIRGPELFVCFAPIKSGAIFSMLGI